MDGCPPNYCVGLAATVNGCPTSYSISVAATVDVFQQSLGQYFWCCDSSDYYEVGRVVFTSDALCSKLTCTPYWCTRISATHRSCMGIISCWLVFESVRYSHDCEFSFGVLSQGARNMFNLCVCVCAHRCGISSTKYCCTADCIVFYLLDTFRAPETGLKTPYYIRSWRGREVSFEACCQWALLNVQITRHYPTIYIYSTEVHLSICKVHVGSFRVSVIHRTLTWTSRFLSCVTDHSYACVYT